MSRGRAARLVALADQVAAYLRDQGLAGATTVQVFHAVWGPCTPEHRDGCHHDVSYTSVYNTLSHLAAYGVAARTPPRGHTRAEVRWVWQGPPPLLMPPWEPAEEDQR